MTPLPTVTVPSPQPGLLRTWRVLLVLAWPVMLSRFGILLMALTDVAMVGRVSTLEVGYLGLGNTIFLPVMITCIGAMTGIIAVTAQAVGRGDSAGQAAAFRAGLLWGGVMGTLALLLTWNVGYVLPLLGHAPEMSEGGRAVARALSPGALFQVLFVVCAFWLEGTGRSRPALVAMIAANLVNVAGNALLIPMMQAEGAAHATTLARATAFAIVAGVVLTRPEMRAALPRAPLPLRPIVAIGLAGGAAYFFETFAFAALGNMAALIGPQALAAYTIVHNLEAAVFMVALGLSIAAAVQVGQAAGAGDLARARAIALAATALTALILTSLTTLLVLFAEPVARRFTDDALLIARIGPLFAVLAVSLVFDGAQVVLGQCVRALGDAWATTLRYFAGFWCVMIPLGYLLGLRSGLEEMGLFIATGCGCAVAAGLLWLRLDRLTRERRLAHDAP